MAGYVNIGRNVGDQPMSDERWHDFRDAVRRALEDRGATFFGRDVTGIGVWQSADGMEVEEDTEYLCFEMEDEYRPLAKAALRDIAGAFDQDAIAWTYSDTEFLRPPG